MCSWAALERDAGLPARYAHVVALDPPLGIEPPARAAGRATAGAADPPLLAAGGAAAGAPDPLAAAAAALAGGHGAMVHLVWGADETRFALAVLEATGELRGPAVALYRAVRDGRPLADALAATGPPAVAGRALRVLTELDLVAVDRATLAVDVPAAQRTDLERSPAFRTAAARLAAGRAQIGRREPAAAAA